MNSEALQHSVSDALYHVHDPEFGINLMDLGLIYGIEIKDGVAHIAMTLTSASCPAGQVLLDGVQAAAESVPGISRAEVTLVWDPPWNPEMLSPAARETLGWE